MGPCFQPVSLVSAGRAFVKRDNFVKRPISALRFISLSLRRTVSTPRATRFARLDLGLFTKSSKRMTFYESIKRDSGVTHPRLSPVI
jgi:hypothetical protein